MKPIIDPMFFYWTDILGNVGTTSAILAFLFISTFIIIFIGYVISDLSEYAHDNQNAKKYLRLLKVLTVPSLFFLAVSLITPSQDTLYKMAAAKLVTPDNVKFTLKAGRVIKDEMLKDILEVINSIKSSTNSNLKK